MPKSNLPDKTDPARKTDKVFPHILSPRERLKKQAFDSNPRLRDSGVLDLMTENELRRAVHSRRKE